MIAFVAVVVAFSVGFVVGAALASRGEGEE